LIGFDADSASVEDKPMESLNVMMISKESLILMASTDGKFNF